MSRREHLKMVTATLPGYDCFVSPPTGRNQMIMLAGWWVELLLTGAGLILMLAVSPWAGLPFIFFSCAYALVIIPRLRERLGFNRWRGGWKT